MKLKDKVAIVTGGAKIVEEFSRDKTARSKTNVSVSAEVQRMIESTVASRGRLDLVVNNAGYHISNNVERTTEQEWEYIIHTNLKSTFLCSKYAIPHLRKTKGCIINISSMVGLVGQSNAGAYSASKGGQIAMTKGMSLEFARDGIRVNAICPGWVQTPLVEDWFN
jgi:NAD(P)-dependent dehydrogenase (short-subunit alcohol dehydrogenase family)